LGLRLPGVTPGPEGGVGVGGTGVGVGVGKVTAIEVGNGVGVAFGEGVAVGFGNDVGVCPGKVVTSVDGVLLRAIVLFDVTRPLTRGSKTTTASITIAMTATMGHFHLRRREPESEKPASCGAMYGNTGGETWSGMLFITFGCLNWLDGVTTIEGCDCLPG